MFKPGALSPLKIALRLLAGVGVSNGASGRLDWRGAVRWMGRRGFLNFAELAEAAVDRGAAPGKCGEGVAAPVGAAPVVRKRSTARSPGTAFLVIGTAILNPGRANMRY